MSVHHWPKMSHPQLAGETGTAILTTHFLREFGWLLRRIHQEHDFGIDGHVEIITAEGLATGRSFAVQIKHGESYFRERTPTGILYRGDRRHLNYYLNYPMSVILIVSQPQTQEIYWTEFSLEKTMRSGENWTIEIPTSQPLRASLRNQLEELAGLPNDYFDKAEAHWQLNELLESASIVLFGIDRHDIEAGNIASTVGLFERIQVSDQLARSMQGKIDIFVHGYDEDARELWEIPEVRQWMADIDPVIKYWFYFLTTTIQSGGLRLHPACLCQVNKIAAEMIEFDPYDFRKWLEGNFLRLNEITERLGLSINENKRICHAVMKNFYPDFDLI